MPSRTRPGLVLLVLLSVLFLTFLDTTIVTVALGGIHYSFGTGVIGLQWVVNAYSLVFASLMLAAGSAADRFGRKTLMAAGIVVFCLGSLICALATSTPALISGRAVMGLGAAASEPGTLSVLRQIYPDRAERGRAIGAWAAVSGVALAAGPVIGGLLIAGGGWRAVFWFNAAAGVAALAAVLAIVPDSADPRPGRPDVTGCVLATSALSAATYGAIAGEQHGYRTWWIVALVGVSALAAIGFVLVELRAANPILNLRYVGKPAVASSLVMAFGIYFGIFSIFFFVSLYLDLALGYSGSRLAGVFAPMAAAIALGSLLAGRWVGRRDPRVPMVAGSVLSAAGIAATGHALTAHPGFSSLALCLAGAGFGFGLAVVPLTATVLDQLPASVSGMAASATNSARQIGTVAGVAGLGAVVNSHITHDFGAKLAHGGFSGSSKDFIIGLLETGGPSATGLNLAHPPSIFAPLVHAGTAAMRNGVHAALLVSVAMILVAALAVALTPRQ